MPADKAKARQLNLDSMRAARLEKSGGPIEVTQGGEVFEFPAELPFEFGELASKNVRGAFALVLDGDAERFFATKPTINDMTALAEGLVEMGGIKDVGESLGSSSS